MKFRIKIADKDTPDNFWWEEYEKNIDDPMKWGKETINDFNEILMPNERERIFLDAEILDKDAVKDHDWDKTNLISLKDRFGIYDIYKCRRCGITGRRYGFYSVNRDSKYKAKVYARCDTALEHLKKKEK